MKLAGIFLLAKKFPFFFLLYARRVANQLVTSNLAYCDIECQAAQRSGLEAYYTDLGGKHYNLFLEECQKTLHHCGHFYDT